MKQPDWIPPHVNEDQLSKFYSSIEELGKTAREALRRECGKCEKDNEPILVIELQDETSVPKVIYKGKEITNKINVFFNWDTDTDILGGLSYIIEHFETCNKYPTINKVERRIKGHAID